MTIPPLDRLPFQKQLAETERWPAERLDWHQLFQLSILADHAWRTVPFYRDRLAAAGYAPGAKIDPAMWSRIPLLTRRDIQDAGDRLHARAVPEDHGAIITATTSGSTGTPVTVRGTVLDARYFKAFALRTHLWHGLDFSLKFVAIRKLPEGEAPYPDGVVFESWGDTATFPFPTGPAAMLNIDASLARQAEWLARQNPHYLLVNPTTLLALTEEIPARAGVLDNLRTVITFAETLDPELRALVTGRWGIEIVDIYSAQEVGYIAVQCPRHPHYHLIGEGARIEILDDLGRRCPPGEIGRVVLSPLHNFAMPLFRYDIGDYAVAGAACDCGRTLPVAMRIMGRARHMLVTPEGDRYWPFFGATRFTAIAPIRQAQFVQTALDTIEARLVADRDLTAEEDAALRARILSRLPWPYRIELARVAAIARTPSGKYEDFRNALVDPPAAA